MVLHKKCTTLITLLATQEVITKEISLAVIIQIKMFGHISIFKQEYLRKIQTSNYVRLLNLDSTIIRNISHSVFNEILIHSQHT